MGFKQMIRSFLEKYKNILGITAILFVCILSYGKILGMYFYLEDYLILFSIQHPESPQAGYGSGIIGRPFGWAVTPFIPFYYLFGLAPWGYYLVEIVLYFFAAIAVYFFTKVLTGERRPAYGAALIFASGYVGSSSVYRLAVGWQNILAAIFISLSTALYYKYIKHPTVKYYLFALAFYLFTSEFSFYRAQGIILVILGMEILFNFKWLKSLIRMAPFILSYWYFYVFSLAGIMDQGSKASSFVESVFGQKNYHYLLNPLKTLENLFIPDKLGVPVLLFIGFLLGAVIWRRSKVLVYCLIFAVANYLVYFYNTPSSIQETTHRYLTISFVGAAAFWGIFLNKVFKNTGLYLLFCILIITLNLTLAHREQSEILQNRSKPNREFWQSFLSQVPVLPKSSAIYIDTKNDGVSKPARDSALSAGSMSATTSFAVSYGLKWDEIYLAENFSELLSFVKTGKVTTDNVYTFFYSRQDGLVNTTEQTKKALAEDGTLRIANLDNINLDFSSPILLSFSSDLNLDFSESGKEAIPNLEQYLDYLLSRTRYFEMVTPASSSQVKYAEIGHITDQDYDTSWRGDDLKWAANHHEEIVLNLGKVRKIGAVRIKPGHPSRVPTKYSYECSNDNKAWKKIAEFEKNHSGDREFVDKFEGTDCAFVKLVITGTISGPPQIAEIEAIEDRFSSADIMLADKIEEDPFEYMSSGEGKALADYLAQNGITGKICVYTNKYNPGNSKCKKHKFVMEISEDSFLIDEGGTVLQKITILVPKQVKINFRDVQAKFLTYKELEKRGYIVGFAN